MDHQAIIKHIYDAFNKRDIDAVFEFFHPDVIWPNGWEGGYVQGQNEVSDYWTRQWREIDPIVTPVELRQLNETTISVDARQLIKSLSGEVIADSMVKHTYTFNGGLVIKMVIG